MPKPISVLIVDDSSSVQMILSHLIAEDEGLTLFCVASDPYEACEKMREAQPDVILLDLYMPRMDGLTFLQKIMSRRPIPVVVISSFARRGSENFLKALELGASEVMLKPRVRTAEQRREAAIAISDAIRAAVQSRGRRKRAPVPVAPGERFTADVILPPDHEVASRRARPLIAIGASTGGTEALHAIFEALPADLPPIAVVQHMPEGFTRAFADRLNLGSAIDISEAADGMLLRPGQAVIAHGNVHLLLHRKPEGYVVELRDGPNE